MNQKISATLVCLAIIVFLVPGMANASIYNGSGKIQILRFHDSITNPDQDWIAVRGFSTAGVCLTNSGLVVLRVRNDGGGKNMLANALTARSLDQTVFVSVDDTSTDANGACYLRYINIR